MTLHELVLALRSGWWIVCAAVLVGIAGSTGLSLLHSPTYSANSVLFIGTTGQTSSAARQLDSQFAQARATTYADLAMTSLVLTPAAVGISGATPTTLRGQVSASSPTGTALIMINATATSPQAAARVANSVASSLSEAVTSLEGQSQANESQVVLHQVQNAVAPPKPDGPSLPLLVLIGTVAGLAGGFVIALIVQSLTRTLRSPRDVASVSGLTPVSVPRAIPGSQSDIGRVEAYRYLRANLRSAIGARGVILMTPIEVGTTAQDDAATLASVFAEVGASALLVDADFRSADGRRLPTGSAEAVTPGLGEFLRTEEAFNGIWSRVREDGVTELAHGPMSEKNVQALNGDSMGAMLRLAAEEYEYVIISAPSVLQRSEAAVLAGHANSTVLRLTSRVSRGRKFLLAVERLRSTGVELSTLVVLLDNVGASDMVPAKDPFEAAGSIASSGAQPLPTQSRYFVE